MKKQTVFFIIIGLFVCFFCIFYLKNDKNSIKMDEKHNQKPSLLTKIVKNDIQEYQLTVNGEICDYPSSEISFTIDGVLVIGDSVLKPGMEFKKNQLLYRINNEQAFLQLTAKKIELAKLFASIVSQLEAKFPEHNGKWQTFLEGIKPTKLLPEYPSLFTPDERIFLIQKEFIQAYVKTKMLEKEMEKYFFLAPFDGIFLESIVLEGEAITAGTVVARIAEKTNLMAKITVPKRELKNYLQIKHVHFTNKQEKIIGNGRMIKYLKHNGKNHSIDILYSVQTNPKYNLTPGQSIKIVTQHLTTEKCMIVPITTINENQAEILVDNTPIKKPIKILAKNKKSIYIAGLNDGDLLILNN